MKPAASSHSDPASDGHGRSDSTAAFPIAGIGASAGGLNAISALLKPIPANCGLAFIIIQHLDPEHASLLVDLLAKMSPLPVQWLHSGNAIQVNRVYIVPPGATLGLRQGVALLDMESRPVGGAIDRAFTAIASDAREHAIGIVLSGNGDDGVIGLKAIKDVGGIALAQAEESAAFPAMPRAAITAGVVDRVLPPDAMGEELVEIVKTSLSLAQRLPSDAEPETDSSEAEHLALIFRLLANRTGIDFSDYKQTTIKRRLVRRMMLAKVADLAEYVKRLHRNRDEVRALYESLLINVTEFFRDPPTFQFVREHVLPAIVAGHANENSPIRLWIPGCSTGEEAFSYGILLRELLEAQGRSTPVQIFATDVSAHAIAVARAGVYSAAEVKNVSPERLQRFFLKNERGYVVQKQLRDMCVFALQNVVKDSPFSRLDLISCRNLMIYINQKMQHKLMPIFHYALNPDGWLVLGNSESVGAHAELFRLVDRRFRVYARKSSGRRASFEVPLDHPTPEESSTPPVASNMSDSAKEPFDIIREADRIVLSRLGLTGVLINEDLDILQFRGDVTPYLAPGEGRASLNLMKMAREGLAAELHAAVKEAKEKNVRVHRPSVSVLHGQSTKRIELDVTPVASVQSKERFYLVLFTPLEGEAPTSGTVPVTKAKKSTHVAQIEQLRHDLQATRSYLQASIEKHEATNQELRAANEEIQASNEELQSTNEELETAKEELQSTNEELTTVNEELHNRQLELIQVNNDLTNLINSVHLPIIILGEDLRIRRFTPMAEKVLNVIPSDVGRPLTDININLSITNLPEIIREVIDSLSIKEIEVTDKTGRWYSMRVRPYKTAENKIEGVVITLIDIDQVRRT